MGGSGILGIYFDFSDVCVTFVSELFVMEKYIVSARKYRPSTFDTLVGQQTLAHTLKAAIRSGRLAHAYNPIAGEGCTGERIRITLANGAHYVPKRMPIDSIPNAPPGK